MRVLSIVFVLTSATLAPRRHPAVTAPLCSLIPFADGRDTSTTYFVGRAQPRTRLAGPGTIRFRTTPGHWGRPDSSQSIYGQVVLVDQLGGNSASRLEVAFARAGAREVVVVPWDYDAACEPVPWARTGPWVGTVDPGFYRVRLRPESLWVDGRPVLDARFGDLEPYPHGVLLQREYVGTDALRRGPSLTPAEYFDLFAVLPEWEQAMGDRSAAAARLDEWERAHPEVARKYPAPEMLRHAHSSLNR